MDPSSDEEEMDDITHNKPDTDKNISETYPKHSTGQEGNTLFEREPIQEHEMQIDSEPLAS